MAEEPDNLVLQILREIRAEQDRTHDRIDGLGRAVTADFHDLDAKIDAKVEGVRKDLPTKSPVCAEPSWNIIPRSSVRA